jgi:replication factor C large subunit
MESDWTEKYRPISLSHIYGNNKAVQTLTRWAHDWDRGIPEKRGIILSGSPGIGKTSAALALANDMEWGIIELNASDVRSGDKIKSIATRGSLFETFTDTGEFIRAKEGGRKLIILDEADNLYERVSAGAGTDASGKDYSDRGGKRAIVETVKNTMQPIILIVNDLYALTKNSTLKSLCHVIKFQKIRVPSIQKALIGIIHNEGVEVEREALEVIATRADGDLRAAINDLQALSKMDGRITLEMTNGMGFRDNVITLQEALGKIFSGTHTDVRKTAWDLNETPDSLLTWLDENLPHAYRNPGDIKRGYDALSRADIYLGRVRRRQYYRLWSYANDMMTAGVALSKKNIYHHYTRYQFPSWIMKMSRTKGLRRSRVELGKKIGSHCHTSIKDARIELLPVFQALFKASEENDFDFAIKMTEELALTPEEIAFLLGTISDDPRVMMILETSVERHGERTGFFPSQLKTKKATLAGFNVKKKKVTKKSPMKKKKSDKKKLEKKGIDTAVGTQVGEGEGENHTTDNTGRVMGTTNGNNGDTDEQTITEGGSDNVLSIRMTGGRQGGSTTTPGMTSELGEDKDGSEKKETPSGPSTKTLFGMEVKEGVGPKGSLTMGKKKQKKKDPEEDEKSEPRPEKAWF